MIVIAAPSNLGLRPLRPGHEPGAWRAPAALFAAGLLDAVGAGAPVTMARPAWKPGAELGTRLRNGRAMRDFNLALADHVAPACARGAAGRCRSSTWMATATSAIRGTTTRRACSAPWPAWTSPSPPAAARR